MKKKLLLKIVRLSVTRDVEVILNVFGGTRNHEISSMGQVITAPS
ncbi:hypothetical protein BN997_00105 [Oceanobacillus oncorhynchi]|uniref:Uncharacterized protein n=1 Tax=Oceanobacillus oncorhynchi TaxID=545501 RepID=A0A0A1MKV5_9BACI|nr:hypothetical protein BN997_00105 [Oceanobacillus oncorhynchi]